MLLISKTSERIAKNTIIVYIRLSVTMIVGLLTSRFVLQTLGISDFGLYNVVGGVLAMFSFLSSSMTVTTTRFINFEEGKKNGDTNMIFNVCLVIHMVLALLILILAETIGIYYIDNYLNVASGKESDAFFVFQVSTIIACVGLINVPYQGLLVAKERFGIIMWVEVVNSILKLGLVLALFLFKNNIIRIYALFMSAMTFVTFVAYYWICIKKWSQIIKFNFRKTKGHYKDVIAFNNYNILGSGALTLRDQGSNIIINFFFGTTVNAAYAISRSIQQYVNTFTANFDIAAAPQITQNFSGGNQDRSAYITGMTGRICMLMMEMAVFPLFVRLDFILKIWLGKVPEGTLQFTQLTLILVFVSSTSAGMVQYINASGKIKWFKIQFAALYIFCLPIVFYLFKQGARPSVIILLFIVSDTLSRVNQLIMLKKMIGFNSLQFMREAYLRPFVIAFLMTIYCILLNRFMPDSFLYNVLNIIITLVTVLILDYFIGLKKEERLKVMTIIKNKLHIK